MSANYCSEEYLETVNYIRIGTFTIPIVACLVAMLLWICCARCDPNKEKWCDFTSTFYTVERLTCYVLILVTANNVCAVFQFFTLVHEKSETYKGFCMAFAFLATFTDTSMLLISIIATVHLVLMTCEKSSTWLQDKEKKNPPRLEKCYCGTVIGGSAVIALIPLGCSFGRVDCYGYDPVGHLCWITGTDENCTRITAGFVMEIVLYYTPTSIAVLLSAAAVGYIIVFWIKKKDLLPRILKLLPKPQDRGGFICNMIILTCYLFCFSIINVLSLVIRISGISYKADTIILTTIWSLWGLIPAIFVFILLLYQWYKRRKGDKDDDYENLAHNTPKDT